MVWVRTERERFINRIGKRGWRDRGIFRCDECGDEFSVLQPQCLKPLKHHFCDEGCKHAFRHRRVDERRASNLIELRCDNSKCGRSFMRDRKKVDRKGRCGLHFCCNACVGASAELRRVKEATCELKYGPGIKHQMQDSNVRAGMQSTMVERYGAPFAWQNPVLYQLVIDKTIERYGVFPAVRSREVQAGIDHVERLRKRRETLSREGRLWTSKPERELGQFLTTEFGHDDVLSQVFIARSSIDFCVRSRKLYVQLDGVFWHGLIAAGRKNDRIRATMERDAALNEWFGSSDELSLLRITDLQWNWVKKNDGFGILLQQLRSTTSGVAFFDCPMQYCSLGVLDSV